MAYIFETLARTKAGSPRDVMRRAIGTPLGASAGPWGLGHGNTWHVGDAQYPYIVGYRPYPFPAYTGSPDPTSEVRCYAVRCGAGTETPLAVCTRCGSPRSTEAQGRDVAARRLPMIRRGELGPAAREMAPSCAGPRFGLC